jgi:hypothetical protein
MRWADSLLVDGTHAPGTDIQPFEFAVNQNPGRMHVSIPAPEGMPL